jgi:tetratricopeptide (TPR) repeat protein
MPHGLLDDAIAEVQRALELDPLSSWTRMWMVVLLYLARQPERAIAAGRTALELDPTFAATHMNVGVAFCQAGRFDQGIASLREAVRLTPAPFTQGWLGLALALNGDEPEARHLLDRFHAMATRTYVPPSSFAWIYLGLGELDEAFAWMDKAVDACDGMMTPIKSYWFLDPIRDDPRFHALLHKMKLE